MTIIIFIKFLTLALIIINLYFLYVAYNFINIIKITNKNFRLIDKCLIIFSTIMCMMLIPIYFFCNFALNNIAPYLSTLFLLEINYLIFLMFVIKVVLISKKRFFYTANLNLSKIEIKSLSKSL